MPHVVCALRALVPYLPRFLRALLSHVPRVFRTKCFVHFAFSCPLSVLSHVASALRSLMFYELFFLMYPYATFNRCVRLLEGRMDIWFCYEPSQKNGWKERYNLYYYLMVSTKMTSNVMY